MVKVLHQPRFFSDSCKLYGKIFQDLPPEVILDLEAFLRWGQAVPQRLSLLQAPGVSLSVQAAFLNQFYHDHACHALTRRVFSVLRVHKRMRMLPDILAYLKESANPFRTVYLFTPKRLSIRSISQLTRRLKQYWNMPVVIDQCEDPDLMLGGILLWDHFIIDASLKKIFTHLKSEMLYVLPSSRS